MSDVNLAESFADFAWRMNCRHCAEPSFEEDFKCVVRALMQTLAQGSVCLDLEVWCREQGVDFETFVSRFKAQAIVSEVLEDQALFVVDQAHRLYLARYFDYELQVADRLKKLQSQPVESIGEKAQLLLNHHFPQKSRSDGLPDYQALATAVAMENRLTVISGGPGTGKTWTVVRILEGLLAQDRTRRIAMAAPTGKAAARMAESVRASLENVQECYREAIPTQAMTIHRLLTQPHPLPFDVIVIDEAGMMGLGLAAKLCQAMHDDTRLILLGDKDQLASVEEGAVFSELSARFEFSPQRLESLIQMGFAESGLPKADNISTLMTDTTVWLKKSFRFDDQKGIGALARVIREGRVSSLETVLSASFEELDYQRFDPTEKSFPLALRQTIVEAYRDYFQTVFAYMKHDVDMSAVFASLKKVGVLAVVNDGPFGVSVLNAAVAQSYREQCMHSADHFFGEIVMVRENNPELGVANGEVGIVFKNAQGQWCVYFETVDSDSAQVSYREIALGRVSDAVQAFAMTVHKSQGSEYERVYLVVPPVSQLLTRELIYTGVTRAKKKLTVMASLESLKRAVMSPAVRLSGLLNR